MNDDLNRYEKVNCWEKSNRKSRYQCDCGFKSDNYWDFRDHECAIK